LKTIKNENYDKLLTQVCNLLEAESHRITVKQGEAYGN